MAVGCVSYVNAVYILIHRKMFFVIFQRSLLVNVCSQGKIRICSLLNRSLQELWDLTSIMILTVLFCSVNTFLQSAELPPKLFHTSLKSVSKQNKLF
jgi:hypothetical protein